MITFGFTMQDRPEALPKEVLVWLMERETKYPGIDFIVDCYEVRPAIEGEVEQYKAAAHKYTRSYGFGGKKFVSTRVTGVSTVTFYFENEQWSIKIVGVEDWEGNIVDCYSEKDNTRSLSTKNRTEIAGLPFTPELPPEYEVGGGVGLLRQPGEPILERPLEMIPIKPEGRYTSEVHMSGAEFNELLDNPDTAAEARKALLEKDWSTLGKLKSLKHN